MTGIWRTQVAIEWTVASGSPGTNTWDFRDTSAGHDSLDNAIASLAGFYQAIRQFFPNALHFQIGPEWRRIDLGPGGEVVTGATSTVNGQAGTSWLPPANVLTLDLATSLPGRSGRGRRFLGPLGPVTSDTDGTVATDVKTVVRNAVATMVSPGPTGGNWVVWSPKRNAAADLSGGEVAEDFGVLRSRRD